MRLDKFLCEMNKGTRSQVKTIIRKGLVTVNGEAEKNPDRKIAVDSDIIAVQGEALQYSRFRYYMLNKPIGVVSATEDNTAQTVLELLPAECRKGLFPAGRLDKDTEGLLLLTNDGALAHNLLSPKKHVAKTYLVGIASALEEADIKALESGVDIGEKHPTKPAKVRILNEKEIFLTICEGKFHQVKRMLQAVNNEVVSLKRTAFGSLKLDESLHTGEYRELTKEEVKQLYACRDNSTS